MFCSACGAGVVAGARFCSSCGKPLPTADLESTGALSPVDPLQDTGGQAPVAQGAAFAVLVVQRGPGEGTAYPLAPPIVHIGRAADQEVFLDDITVSRRHAELRLDGNTWTLVDLGSLNGTYVNKEAVQEAPLVSGDEIQIGKFRFRFMAGAG